MDARANDTRPWPEFCSGMRDIVPLALGVATYGAAFGLLAAQAGFGGGQTGVMGGLVFAGSSQIVAAERLVAGAGVAAALVAGLALNLRLILMTSSLRIEFAGRPLWQVLWGVHLTSDENWALMHAARARGRVAGYWYLVGGGMMLWVVWVTSTMIGAVYARTLPDPRSLGIDFAFTAAFIAILCSLWRGRGDLAPWVTSAACATLLTMVVPIDPTWALVGGGVAGAAVAGRGGHE
ncbi:AzlC family protein [Acuticoccus sediminis]|uniref:AzlC family protein n=2 Tax=Acuticoccus sediminis TaxID=2184697 RepID=A0A8B2NUY4_9HYPH|nr:AzlC family protein [Acuticoccus sediminis]